MNLHHYLLILSLTISEKIKWTSEDVVLLLEIDYKEILDISMHQKTLKDPVCCN
jgi:hypothetical protein